jgi:hypothetical protein
VALLVSVTSKPTPQLIKTRAFFAQFNKLTFGGISIPIFLVVMWSLPDVTSLMTSLTMLNNLVAPIAAGARK